MALSDCYKHVNKAFNLVFINKSDIIYRTLKQNVEILMLVMTQS